MKIAYQDSSVLRKFTILFVVMSLLPISVLYYFYVQIRNYGILVITDELFNIALSLMVIGVGVGYWAMRSVIKELMNMTRTSTQTIQDVLGRDKFKNIGEGENEIVILTRSFSAITARLKQNIRDLELAKKTLHSILAKVGSGLASMENIDTFLDLIVETIAESLEAEKGILLFYDEGKKDFLIKSIHGIHLEGGSDYRVKIGQGSLDAVIKTRKPIVIEKLEHSNLPEEIHQTLSEGPLLCAPLFLRDNLLGIIVVGHKRIDDPFNKDEMGLINNIALQTAVAIENSKLNKDAERTYLETISALALAVEAKDLYSRGHSDQVAAYAIKIAKKMNLSEVDIATLRDAARLHDIGKIGIYDDVLRKPGKLTPEERKMIEKHPEIGESIIKPVRSLRPLCDIVRHHHEFLDGTGYPDGLKEDNISLLTRILTVSDIYDALTSDRPYRKQLSTKEAENILLDMGEKLDQGIVRMLFEVR